MKNIDIILSLCGTALGLFATTVTFLVQFIKNIKAKKIAEQTVKIGNAILPLIKEAEKFTAYTGAEKKAYVMTKASQFALANHIAYNEQQVSNKVEELVALTRQVNAKLNTKEKAEIKKEINAVTAPKSWL